VSQPIPNSSAASPVNANAIGKTTDGAFAVATVAADAPATTRGEDGLTAADKGREASIGFFLCFGDKAAFFQPRIQVHWPPIGSGAKTRAFRQDCHCLQNFNQGLRRFQAARIYFHFLKVL